MIKESNLIRLPILNENYEPISYEIKNIIYCFEKFCILGLHLHALNSQRGKKVLLFTKIKEITEKGILIDSIDDVVDIDQVPEIKKALDNYKPVIGYEIYLNNSEIIGIVKDTLVQISSGKILGFIMSEGLFDDLINGYSFLPLVEGINLDECKIMLNEQERLKILPQEGGLKKMLGIEPEK